MTKIAVLVGSLSRDSINKKLANNLESLMPEHVEIMYGRMDLPLFNYELESEFPQEARELKGVIEAADGVLLVSPEYNRTTTAVMKNAIDWASRPWGDNSFKGKPAGIVGASSGPLGTSQAQGHLRSVMVYLEAKLLGQPEVYLNGTTALDESGVVVEESREFLQRYVDAFIAHVEAYK